jgi:hypothetical protein
MRRRSLDSAVRGFPVATAPLGGACNAERWRWPLSYRPWVARGFLNPASVFLEFPAPTTLKKWKSPQLLLCRLS